MDSILLNRRSPEGTFSSRFSKLVDGVQRTAFSKVVLTLG